MANAKHVELLCKGVDVWNSWRRRAPRTIPDLRRLNFVNPYADEKPVCGEHISDGWFNLAGIDFHGANLTGADLSDLDLRGADLSESKLVDCYFSFTLLDEADLRWADLTSANIRAQFEGAKLQHARFVNCNMDDMSFGHTHMGGTILAGIDLSKAMFLDTVVHHGRSFITVDTIAQSHGAIADEFLRGAGLSNDEIEWVHSFHRAESKFHSCFISYSHQDAPFAARLHRELQDRGIRCWLDEEHLLAGQDLYEEVARRIRDTDKVLLCCSRDALESWWVKNEIVAAFEKEQQCSKQQKTSVQVLVPLNLDDYLLSPDWQSGFAAQLRGRRAVDFTKWKTWGSKHDIQLDGLVKALRIIDVGPRS